MSKKGSQLGKWAKVWTPEEDERVRRAWAAPRTYKAQMGMFPGRTHEAVKARALNLGLGPKPNKSVRSESPATTVITDYLIKSARPVTIWQIIEQTKCAERTVREILNRGRGERFYVAGYVRLGKSTLWQPKWAYGTEEDAVKPRRMTTAEASRSCRLRKRLTSGAGNPFAIAMNQIMRVAA
jgi:hypothetical protein